MINLDLILWMVGGFIAIMVLVSLANRRRRHLEALLNDYIQRQVLWVRRKKKAAELKLAKVNGKPDSTPES